MGAYLFTDADNTLWDTDAVYRTAHLALLADTEAHLGRTTEVQEDVDRLAYVRAIDQRIAASHPDHLRYPLWMLVEALCYALDGLSAERAAAAVLLLSENPATKPQIELKFAQLLRATPVLRPGVEEGLEKLARREIPVSVITEGSERRCLELLGALGLRKSVRTVFAIKKTPSTYRDVAVAEGVDQPWMVGDQVDRDIIAATKAGYNAIFFPGGFVPFWAFGDMPQKVKTITRFDEVLSLVEP